MLILPKCMKRIKMPTEVEKLNKIRLLEKEQVSKYWTFLRSCLIQVRTICKINGGKKTKTIMAESNVTKEVAKADIKTSY
jgi:hypothetical protein